MTERVECCVPLCRRTIGKPYDEWICAKHWPGVPKHMKAALRRAKARYRRAPSWDAGAACDRLWKRCKRAAIERAFGVG